MFEKSWEEIEKHSKFLYSAQTAAVRSTMTSLLLGLKDEESMALSSEIELYSCEKWKGLQPYDCAFKVETDGLCAGSLEENTLYVVS